MSPGSFVYVASLPRRARDARIQLTLLRNEDSADFQTDFYSYRYFASEGFLPGYSFPRLPLAAVLAAAIRRRDHQARFAPGPLSWHSRNLGLGR